MTRNAETPDTPAVDGSWPAAEAAPAPGSQVGGSQSGPVVELGLVAAGLGLVIFLISFVADLGGTSSPVLPLLLGGGLLAGTVALPTVGGRMLAPAAVVTTTGALLLLRTVADDGGGALVVGALVLGLLEAGAAVGATLMQAGVVRSRPPKARKTSSAAFAGNPAGPQFPGHQYPGQPFPGAYPGAQTEPYPGDQWTGEHAYGQNAQYGSQYGVPGYPPPPPFGAPGYDPAVHAAEAPTVAVGADSSDDDTASPPRGTRPVTEPVAGAGDLGVAHQAVPDPGASAFRTDAATGTGAHRAVPDPGAVSGTGSFRAGSRSAAAEGTGSPRVSYPAAGETTPVSGTGAHRRVAARPRSDDDEHTRTLPAVPDEPR